MHVFARIFSDAAISNSNKFHRYYIRGLLFRSFKSVTKNFLDIFTDDVQMVKKPAQISGSFIDHFYIKRVLMEKFFTMVTVKKIYFWDHDAVRIAIEKNSVDIHITP